ncbi:hypothetical protein EV144_105157 [Flavobacterium sp. 270]|uniref:hypothetical protein n=1 Tax=Flavobacterium sp. 270 TaxID=2512114 RepID=UPI0010E31A9F|nr:hypothetical protein [Flavobacterium sp. 270]TDW47141.1 hypothetical protein EV144_105157 [Flavobacterium sp. 270]
MKWKKRGQIFTVSKGFEEIVSHASNPVAVHLKNDIYRIFFSARNSFNKSSVSYVDINILTLEIVNNPHEVVFSYGADNSFYSHGVSIGNFYTHEEKNYILFMGWQIRENQHWKGEVGRLELLNKETLKLVPLKAFMVIDQEDSISLSYPWVTFHDGVYKMWYGSTLDWTSENGEMIHVIKYATSIDGENWVKHGVAIPYEIGIAQAFSKPSVIIDNGGYHMWYSYRSGNGTAYRIGYSHSDDGINWQQQHNKVGIDVSNSGWDSEMICYPFVFQHKNSSYMLYNGNNYGKNGFGIAILENDRF